MTGNWHPIPPATDDPLAWNAYWRAVEQPWRREPEIGEHRQLFLLGLVESFRWACWGPALQGILLHRSDVEWLIAEDKKNYSLEIPAIDLRGADTRRVDFECLDLSILKLDPVQQLALVEPGRRSLSRNAPDATRYRLLAAYVKGERTFHNWGLAGVDLSELRLEEADLTAVNLSGANLSSTYLGQSRLSSADLRRATLRRASLDGCNLSGADLSEADLTGASLMWANLEKATLRNVVAVRANFRRTTLDGIVLDGANLQNVDMYGATPWDIDLTAVAVGPERRPTQGPDPAYDTLFYGGGFWDEEYVRNARFDVDVPSEPEDPSV